MRDGDHVLATSLKREVSDYLDSCGLRMSPPKYPYDKNDTKTWKYIETPNTDGKMHREPTMLNPDWIYKEQAIANGDY